MMYGNGYFGVLEANYALACTHLISAIFGADTWHQPLGTLFPYVPEAISQVPAIMALFWVAVTCMSLQVLQQAWRVYFVQHKMDARACGHKELGLLNATKHLAYILIFFALAYLFLMQPYEGQRLKQRFMLEMVVFGYATIATQVILAHMAKEAYIPAWTPYLMLMLGAGNSYLGLFPDAEFVYVLSAAVLIAYLHYVINVVDQCCEHLGIRCLTITPRT
jgi:ethanolaminephosphotransferase